MTDIRQIIHLLRNIPVREVITALERDAFYLRRSTRTGGHIYVHPDGRRAVNILWHLPCIFLYL